MSSVEGLGRKTLATAKFTKDFESKLGHLGTQADSTKYKPLVQEAVNLIFDRYFLLLNLSLCSYAFIRCLQPIGKSRLDIGTPI